jgi:hypothetical protein
MKLKTFIGRYSVLILLCVMPVTASHHQRPNVYTMYKWMIALQNRLNMADRAYNRLLAQPDAGGYGEEFIEGCLYGIQDAREDVNAQVKYLSMYVAR